MRLLPLLLGLTSALARNEDLCVVPEAISSRPAPGMYAGNRQRAMTRLLAALGNDANRLRNGLVYVQGGAMENWYSASTERFFRQESNFLYLCEYENPYSVGVISAECVIDAQVVDGQVVARGHLFVQRPDERFAIWDGEPYTLESLRRRYNVEFIEWRDNMNAYINNLNKEVVYGLSGVQLSRSAGRAALEALRLDTQLARPAIGASRSIKSQAELALLRISSKLSAFAHRAAMYTGGNRGFEAEYQVQTKFQATTGYCSQHRQAYLTIAPADNRTSILHYNLNPERIHPTRNDMILLDGASEGFGYGSDITRAFPSNLVFTPRQRTIYNAVLSAQNAALGNVRNGANWQTVTRAATVALVDALITAGLIVGSLNDALNAGVAGTFMPHGLGHHVGLDVHDPGPISPMANNMVVTIEPGIYFINAVLERDFRNPTRSRFLNRDLINEYRAEGNSLGGVRIEDVIVVTQNGFEMISGDAPRRAEDVEEFIRSGKFTFDAEQVKRDAEATVAYLNKKYPNFVWPEGAPALELLPPQ